MRVAAQQPGRRQTESRRSPFSYWLVVACVALAASVFYLALSIQQALQSDPDDLLPADADVAIEPPASLPPPNPTVAPRVDDAIQSAPPPRPGLAPAVGDPALRHALEVAAGDDIDHIAVSVRRVSDGRAASIHGDYQFYAASTFKLAVLYEAELRHFRGDLEYSDTVTLSDQDRAEDLGTSGQLVFEDDGSITIEHLLQAMITVSDNASAVALLHLFGGGAIDETLRDLGLNVMSVNHVELWTTADDLARLMEAIYVGEGVGPVERDQMRELLLGQTIRNGIPGALSNEVKEGLRIGNKTGTWPGAQHDVAFVEAQSGAYVIAILTDGSYEGWMALQRVTLAAHKALAET